MIGDDIEITVVDIRGDKVRLGITAPTRVAVHRKEVYAAIKAENEAYARAMAGDFPQPGDRLAEGVDVKSSHRCDGSCPPQVKPAPKTAQPASRAQTPFRSSSGSRATTAA